MNFQIVPKHLMTHWYNTKLKVRESLIFLGSNPIDFAASWSPCKNTNGYP